MSIRRRDNQAADSTGEFRIEKALRRLVKMKKFAVYLVVRRHLTVPKTIVIESTLPSFNSQRDSRNPIPSCPDLTQIVKAWAKLPAPLKAGSCAKD
jgi:hypothetical protein